MVTRFVPRDLKRRSSGEDETGISGGTMGQGNMGERRREVGEATVGREFIGKFPTRSRFDWIG